MTSLMVGLVCSGYTGQAYRVGDSCHTVSPESAPTLAPREERAAKKTVSLDIVLKPRQTKTLSQLALAVNTTDSQSFKGYLTSEEFRAKFGQLVRLRVV